LFIYLQKLCLAIYDELLDCVSQSDPSQMVNYSYFYFMFSGSNQTHSSLLKLETSLSHGYNIKRNISVLACYFAVYIFPSFYTYNKTMPAINSSLYTWIYLQLLHGVAINNTINI